MNLFQTIKWLFGGARPSSTNSTIRSTTTIIHHHDNTSKGTSESDQAFVSNKSTKTTRTVTTGVASAGAVGIAQFLNDSKKQAPSVDARQEITALKNEAESLLAENFAQDTNINTARPTNSSTEVDSSINTSIEEGSDIAEIAADFYRRNKQIDSDLASNAPTPNNHTLNDDPAIHLTHSSNITKHIIIGAGPAGVVAAETIRKLDSNAAITIIGDEPEAPYSRMAIPYFLEENIEAEGTHLRKVNNHFADANIQIIQQQVTQVDSVNNLVKLEDGQTLPWDKLLVATGSRPVKPAIPGLDNPKVANCWTLADSRKIIEYVKPGSHIVQIGAGFIGCIILEALVKRGAALTVVEMDNRMVPRMLDEQCGGMLKSWCESKGVRVLTETQVSSIENNGDALIIHLSQGEPLNADFVISATGVRSNTEFLTGSGIKLDQGILVNEHLESSIPNIYAAGDVAQGIDFTTGGYSVHAIQPTAADHGIISAKNMVQGNSTCHKGSLQMNVLSTLDLISTSYGAWEGVDGGESSELIDTDRYRYIRLQFSGDRLVGANTLGVTQNIGALRGLIQSETHLGVWKAHLMENPLHFMDAYVSITGNHA